MSAIFLSKWTSWDLKTSNQPSDKSDKSPSGTNGTDSNGYFQRSDERNIQLYEVMSQAISEIAQTFDYSKFEKATTANKSKMASINKLNLTTKDDVLEWKRRWLLFLNGGL